MFFTVSGGPFGLEGLVGSVGPGVALLLLVATPLVYSVPETLLIGELASMLPVEGGYYQWVKRAFGRFWGFWNGWLSWTYSLLDMAIYPVLFIQYLRFFAPGLSQLEAWLVALALIWAATGLNLRGTVVVGTASGWFVATVLLPFGVLAGVAITRWIGQPATAFPVTPVHAAGSSFLGALGLGASQSARHAAQRGARLGAGVFGVRAVAVRRAAGRRRAAVQRGAGARVRGAGAATAQGARVARRVPRAGGGAVARHARGASPPAAHRRRRARGAEPDDRAAGSAGGRGARRHRAAPVCRAALAPGTARAAARAVKPWPAFPRPPCGPAESRAT